MKIAFFAPFKPLGHSSPSGDLTIARGIVGFLEAQGHQIIVPSHLRTRWIYLAPWKWPLVMVEFIRAVLLLKQNPPDIWLTYHTYYKAPDILGPLICRILRIKYVIFQGIYSTRQRRRLKTVMGFWLNRAALNRADHVFTNKSVDLKNLKRLIPDHKLTYIKPGLHPGDFKQSKTSRNRFRTEWGIGGRRVILAAAMFRDDVKTKGLLWLISCCETLKKAGVDFILVIAGSGCMENEIKTAASEKLAGQVRFVGKVPPRDMADFYSTGDIFAFPGIGESLGMVFLEAQSCGLPVVAFDNAGVPEAVVDGKTGFLTPMYDCQAFNEKLLTLLMDEKMRTKMGHDAVEYVTLYHDLDHNYQSLNDQLIRMVRK